MKTELISLIVCPITKGKLLLDKDNQYLISKQADLAFSIDEGLPNMLVDEALSLEEFKQKFPSSKVFKPHLEFKL